MLTVRARSSYPHKVKVQPRLRVCVHVRCSTRYLTAIRDNLPTPSLNQQCMILSSGVGGTLATVGAFHSLRMVKFLGTKVEAAW